VTKLRTDRIVILRPLLQPPLEKGPIWADLLQ
jgi:hypothetical protein